ncbi:MAG: transposase [Planctomycetaceae bacterium]|nr:transposase [Planctomycetaceae bacterium]
MSTRAYSEINFHVTWHVKDDEPILCDEVEAQLQRFLQTKAAATSKIYFHVVGGTDTHVHIVFSQEPDLLTSTFIGELKGASAHFINHQILNRKALEWQSGYGIVCFGSSHLPWVADYVRNQRQRHAKGDIHERLERTEPEERDKPAEAG